MKLPEFTKEDLSELSNTISITRQIAETHFGLGIKVAFLKTCDTANMGCVQVGLPGVGKTKSLIAIKGMKHRPIFTKKFTMAGVRQKFNDFFTDSETTWIAYDLADMSKITVENMLKVICDVLTDHACQVTTKHYNCDIYNANISFLGACTYEIYNKLWEIPAWRGNFKDRILRYFAFSFKRKNVNPKDPHATITLNMPKADKVRIRTSLFNEIVEMLECQFTSERSFEYAQRLLIGSARLNHRDEATNADAKFILLHRTNIEAEMWASKRERLSSPLIIDSDVLLLFSEAMKRFGVSLESVAARYSLKNKEGAISIESLIEGIFANPKLFKKIGNYVFPNYNLLTEKIIPQIKFERMCLQRGDKYYLH